MRDYTSMPKVELHLHLEGAIPLPALWELVQRRGGHPEVGTMEDLEQRFRYDDFAHFIEVWVWKNQFLDSYEAFEFIAESVARDLSQQNIVYAEAFFSPTDFGQFGLEPGPLAMAIRRGLDSVSGVEVALIADLVRETGPERAAVTLDRVLQVAADAGVIGITIGGFEAEHPPQPFAPVYLTAREAGLRLTAHAGEAAGPESVWGAIRELGVDRIGHGVRSVEDPDLMEYLVGSQLPLEVCPTSNLRTEVVDSWESHPARALIEAGAMVTINTDDPAMFGCDLAGEFAAVQIEFDLADGTMRRLAANAISAAWAPASRKAELLEGLAAWWASNDRD